jgi:hypothetical protein
VRKFVRKSIFVGKSIHASARQSADSRPVGLLVAMYTGHAVV